MTEITPSLGLSAYFLGRRIAGQRRKPERVPVAYLYNGVRLPGLPVWDRVKYPYAAAMWTTMLGSYDAGYVTLAYLYLSTVPLSYKRNGSRLYATADGSVIGYYINTESGVTYDAWKRYEEKDLVFSNGDLVDSGTATYLRWSNYDVSNYDDGTLYLASSDPIPVYE